MGSWPLLRRWVLSSAATAALACGGNELTLPTEGEDGGGSTGGSTPPPSNPAPTNPAPSTPAPGNPEPSNPGPSNPGPSTPAPTAARIEAVEGNSQRAVTGEEVPVRPAVRVVDSQGNPVAGYPVTFVVTTGAGTLLNPAQATDSEGIARVGRWTLGSAGVNTVEARAETLAGSPVVLEATVLSRADVDHFVFVMEPDGARVDQSQTVEVALVDAAGNVVPLSGIEMYLGLFRREEADQPYSVRNDLLLGDRFADTRKGIATFRLGVSRSGTYQFRVLSDELPELGLHGPEPYVFSRHFNVY
jgi:hypothetical protein